MTIPFIIAILVSILVPVSLLLFLNFPGKPKPFKDQNGHQLKESVSEKTFIDVNGTKQGMIIQSKNAANPVLLYLHGGMPDYFLTKRYPTGLEEFFTVVWWEQRGSGLSYIPKIQPETMTLQRMILDTVEVTNYLRNRFGKEKIYLMGHSGGSFIGIQAAAKAPELYYAYIGVAQMCNQLKSELLAYQYMVEQFKKQSNKKMLRKLEAAPVSLQDGTPKRYLAIRDTAMHSLGVGTTHDMNSVVTGIFLSSLASPDYNFREKINLWRGKASAGVSTLWDEMTATDLSEQLTKLDIPIYFFEGIYDYTCSYKLAKEYFDKIQAPIKGFYTFKASAHSPIFEEPEKVQKIMQNDVLPGKTNQADINEL